MDGDLRTLLAAVAPAPSDELDVASLRRRAARLRRSRRGAAAAVVVVGLAVGVVAAPRLVAPRPPSIAGLPAVEQLRGQLDDDFGAAVDALGVSGAAAAVVLDDGSTWTAAAGIVGDAADGTVVPGTAFPLGHLTELVTAAAVADLVDDGIVAVDDPVTAWLPDLRTDATVADLLHHRSGLPDVAVVLGTAAAWDPGGVWTQDEVLAAVAAADAAPPGDVALTDTDGVVLGRLVEVADGRSLADALDARVLGPLSAGGVGFLPSVGTDGAGAPDAEAAAGFDAGTDWTAWASARRATAGMVGSAEDAARLLHRLLGEDAGAPYRATLLDRWDEPTDRGPQRGAAGLVRGMHQGWREVWRAGRPWMPRYGAALLHVPDLNATVVVVTDRGAAGTGAEGAAGALLDAVAGVLLDATVAEASRAVPGRTQVWVAGDDGSDPRPLTDWPGQVLPLDWSPDGRWLLVQSDRDGDWDLWLVSRDGADERQVTDEPGMESFARISPDGTQVAFTDDLAGDAELWVVGVDGQGMRTVVGGVGTDEWMPAWSPDGASLLFVRTARDDRSASELWTVRVDGDAARRVDTGRPGLGWADWSWGADTLVGGTVDGLLVTLRPDGGDVRAVAEVDRAWHPRWGPGGSIVFARGGTLGADGLLSAGPGDPRDLWLVDVEGRVAPWLVRPGDQSLPVWSPDGALVAFAETPAVLP